MIFENDKCYTEAQTISRVGRITTDLGEISAKLSGFDKKFELEYEGNQMNFNEFWSTLIEYSSELFYKQWFDNSVWNTFE